MPKRGEPANEAQRAAAARNLAKGQKARKERMAANADHPKASERWAMLLSGQITVKDLDDDEIKKMRVRGKGGEFNGRAPAVPSHLARQFAAEQHERWKRDILEAVPSAIDALKDILGDNENPQQAAMVRWTIERALGKTPDVVIMDGSTGFERVAESVVLDRDLADDAESYLAAQTTQGDGNSQ